MQRSHLGKYIKHKGKHMKIRSLDRIFITYRITALKLLTKESSKDIN